MLQICQMHEVAPWADLLQGPRLPVIDRGGAASSTHCSTQGRGLKTGLPSVSPKRATEQKGLG